MKKIASMKKEAPTSKAAAFEETRTASAPKENWKRANFKFPESFYANLQLLARVRGTSVTQIIIDELSIVIDKNADKLAALRVIE